MAYDLPLNVSTPMGYFEWSFQQTEYLPPYLFLVFVFMVSASWLYYVGGEGQMFVGASLLTLIVAILFQTLGWVSHITMLGIFGLFIVSALVTWVKG